MTDSSNISGVHPDTEGGAITINVDGHPKRTDSPTFINARSTMHKILTVVPKLPYGPEPVQAHHGGSCLLYDDKGWFLVLNQLGIEWSSQFCAAPEKIDLLRVNAERLYAGFPKSEKALTDAGCNHVHLLHEPITDADGVAKWTDSIFNSCVPLPAQWHTGRQPNGAGEHSYPRPITNIEFIKRDDFVLFHAISGGHVAVVPTGPPGSGARTVEMVWATEGTPEHKALKAHNESGERLILHANHHIAKAAFALQS